MACKKSLEVHGCKLGSSVLQVGLQDIDPVSGWAGPLLVSYQKSCLFTTFRLPFDLKRYMYGTSQADWT